MAEKKMTMRDYYVALREAVEQADFDFGNISIDEMLAFIDKRIEQVDKKRASAKGGEKKMTETQKANEVLKANIVEALAEMTEGVAVGYMLKNFKCCAGLSSSKVTSMLNQLVAAGMVKATKVKGQNSYTLA